MEFDADLHSTSRHVNDKAGPLSATECIVESEQHRCQHGPKMEEMPVHPSAMHRLMLHRGTTHVDKRQCLCRTSAFQLSDMDTSMTNPMQLRCNRSFPGALMLQSVLMSSSFDQSSSMFLRIAGCPIYSCFGGQLGIVISFTAAKLP